MHKKNKHILVTLVGLLLMELLIHDVRADGIQGIAMQAATCTSAIEAEFPKIVISNGQVLAVVYLPDAARGYYRASRFDWSGVVACLSYRGHTYFSAWTPRYDPTVHESIMGPVEEFRSSDGDSSIGYTDAKPGGVFVKPGVGLLRKVADSPYDFTYTYPLVDGGHWTIRSKSDEVTFTQTLRSRLGVSYVYQKTLRLARDEPVLVLEHHLTNIGTQTIDTEVYQHDFFVLDGATTGPDLVISFPFTPRATRPLEPLATLKGNDLVYLQTLMQGQTVTSYLTGYSDSVTDYDIVVEDRSKGFGVEQTADVPIAKLNFWSISTTICPEAYVHLIAPPGDTKSWAIRYRFFER